MRLELIAIKNIVRRKQRVFFLLFTIIVAVAIVNSLYQLNTSMSSEIGNSFDRLGPNIIITVPDSNLDVSPTPLIADDYMKVYQIPERNSIAVVSPKLLDVGNVEATKALLLGVYFQFESQLKPWWSWDGQLPFKTNEVLLGRNIATELQKSVGDTLQIENQEFTITGILNVTNTDEDKVVFLPLLTLQSLKNRGQEISFIEVAALCTSCPLPDIAEQIRQVLPNTEVKTLQESVAIRQATIERIQEFMLLGSIIILLISCFIVGMTMMNYVFERKVDIGVLRAVGLRRAHVFEVLITEAVIIGATGGLLGYAVGTIMAKYITPYIISLPLTIEFNVWFGGVSVIISILLTILASLYPINKVTKLDPVDALKL
jgi:putative ABC transport system permease protein